MVFVTAILQDACLSIKVANKPVYFSCCYIGFFIIILCLFSQGGQQPGWERGERYLILCLSELTFSYVFFLSNRSCVLVRGMALSDVLLQLMFVGTECFRSVFSFWVKSINSCLSFLITLIIQDRRRRERGRDDPGGDPRGQRGELHRQERHPHNLQDWRESRNWLKSIIVAKIVKEYT